MKQTAVEWLQEQLKNGIKYNPLEKNGYSNAEAKLFEQAKEMEKQQQAYNEEKLYSEIEWLIISWNNDGTKTAGHLTRQIIEQLKKK
jgi:hypothetical protein